MKMPPVADIWAHQILRHAAGAEDHPAAFLAAAESAHGQLQASLTIFFGEVGFDALWVRALTLASQSRAGRASPGADARLLRTPGWPDALSGLAADEARSVVVAAFTNFIDVLFTLVGVELGSRLLSQVWPQLPEEMPGTTTGDVPE